MLPDGGQELQHQEEVLDVQRVLEEVEPVLQQVMREDENNDGPEEVVQEQGYHCEDEEEVSTQELQQGLARLRSDSPGGGGRVCAGDPGEQEALPRDEAAEGMQGVLQEEEAREGQVLGGRQGAPQVLEDGTEGGQGPQTTPGGVE